MHRTLYFICAIIIIVIAGIGYLLFKDTTPPELSLTQEIKVITPGQKLTVNASDMDSGIRSITVTIRKSSQSQVLAKYEYPDKQTSRTAEFAFKDTFLRDGAFTLIINASDGSFAGFGQGNSVTSEYAMTMDTTPPKVVIKTAYPYVRRGGSGCISYKVSRDVEATGVKIGEMYFPGYLQDNGDYICFFPFPYTMEGPEFQPELEVTDLAGNKSLTRVPLYRVKQRFKTDTVRITDRFFDLKLHEFKRFFPEVSDQLVLFNKVNGELRKSNAEKLLEIGQNSAPRTLWNDAFLPLPNAAVKAGFAEHRSYIYNDVKQDVEATHLGLDLASIARSPVSAGNDGVVVFADYLGIYGNLVVLDHGLGLQSLYSHLSEISVAAGDKVIRGQAIGRTGATGMAVGDHLHFGILISGFEVSPIEWLDRKWIQDNIVGRLEEAETPGLKLVEPPVPQPKPEPANAKSSPVGRGNRR